MDFVRPPRLQPGDTIATVSPSWGGPSLFPHIYDHGVEMLGETFGLKTKEYPTAKMDAQALYLNPKARAADINAAFADPEVKAIITSIGGEDSVRILPYLDREIIQNNPKILMGYSDTTTLLTFANQLGLVTFNGPSIMAGFCQLTNWSPNFIDHVRAMLFEGPASYTYQPYDFWTERYHEWADFDNGGRIGPVYPNEEKWQWLQGEGVRQGHLFGGCIEVLEFMKGIPFWPAPDFWQDKILFFETSEDKPTPLQVKWMVRNYGMQGVFERIKGILFGRARDYSAAEKQELYTQLTAVVTTEFGRSDLPIIANMDFGHTDPQFIMPLGVQAEIDCEQRTFRLLERTVE